jgi:hypothetical protein
MQQRGHTNDYETMYYIYASHGLNKLGKFTLLWLDFVIFFANSFNVALVV